MALGDLVTVKGTRSGMEYPVGDGPRSIAATNNGSGTIPAPLVTPTGSVATPREN